MLLLGNRNENIVLYTQIVGLHGFTSTLGSAWVEYCYSSMQRLWYISASVLYRHRSLQFVLEEWDPFRLLPHVVFCQHNNELGSWGEQHKQEPEN